MRDILADLGEPTAPQDRARTPPSTMGAAGTDHYPSADPAPKLAPDFEFDQRLIC